MKKMEEQKSLKNRIRFMFLSLFGRKPVQKDAKNTDETDVESDEVMVLRYVLLKHALDAEGLHETIKGTFGLDIPTEEIEKKIAVSLYKLIKQESNNK
ncbi:MAG: hypothetical protein K5912_03240 [Alphaproteobacteria bacterium]|nr:hypothetical protein [Alphaproteobacteria bacterium]